MRKVDLKPGAPVLKLTIAHGEVFAGDVSSEMKPAKPFTFLPAVPPA